MNSSTRRSDLFLTAAAALAALILLWPAASNSVARAAGKSKGIDVEIPYEVAMLKTPGIAAPYYLNEISGGKMVVSDRTGGVYSVTFAAKVTELAGKAKLKHPAGVAAAPAGFGAYQGQIFVLNADDEKASCEVDRIDASGAVSTFAKLPDGGSGKPTDCRDLEFGPASSPFAGKLFAATTGNSAIYAVDSSGKASVFGAYDKPLAMELTTIGFAPATDPKAPNTMLVGMRPSSIGGVRGGRISIVAPDGKLKDDVYMVGFMRATGFGTSPSGWGSYPDTFFIADAGKLATENNAAPDGEIYRVYKDVPRTYAKMLIDPTCLKFINNRMVLCDPCGHGKVNDGAIVVISSML
ncbi:MAG TPA: hypothetical protein VEC38_10075 [Candidatus Binataceae bacterium]|nr:hypothetical protein [Candidatus Binataceae bacterium]